MKNYIKITLKKAYLIAILSFLTFSPAYAQYKLELEWQKEIGGGAFNIRSLEISKDDSIIIVNGSDFISNDNRQFMKISASDGRILSTKANSIVYNFMKFSKDNSILVCGSEDNNSVDVYDYLTLEQKMSFKFPVMIKGTSFCEQQMKAVACGNGLIRIYDIIKKEMVRDYKLGGINAKLSDNGKYIVYSTSYQNGTSTEYRISLIDTSGKEIKNIETSSPNFAFTNDGKNLIYFDKVAAQLLNLETMTVTSKIPNVVDGSGYDPTCIEISSDGKYVFTGGGGFGYFDFENNKRTWINLVGGFYNFKLDSSYSSVYVTSGESLYKFNLKPTTSVQSNQDNLVYRLQTNQNTLIISSQSILNPNLQFSIVTIDGKLIRQILPNDIQLNNNSANIDISSLSQGAYFLQITQENNQADYIKFIKTE